MRTLLVVVGPTGVGKTEVCLRIAEKWGIPVINADSRQLFAEIPIGTAAPTREQLARVKHYFVGNLHLTDYYSASKFETDVLTLLQSDPAFTEKSIGLMSGGSMMYVDAVCHGIDDIPTIDAETRAYMKERLEREGLERLVEELRLLDPAYYAIVDRKNTRRVVHALEICHATGKTYTSFRTNGRTPRWFKTVKIGLNRDRDELYDRINKRVLQMIDQGWVEEVLNVYPFRAENALNTVGYKELFEYLDGLCTLENAITRIQSNTRRYCRKQLTWYKRDPSVCWFHPDDLNAIFDHIQNHIY